jgi:hypothetical protein
VAGTRKIASVEIVRNGEVVHAAQPDTLDAGITWEDRAQIPSGCYYYVRVTQSDGEQAWSSPIWVDIQA